MNATAAKKHVDLALGNRFGDVFERREKRPLETLSTGVTEIDNRVLGFPRGAISEIHGRMSSGRTSLLLSALGCATKHEEICALVDCTDTFDLSSASHAGVDFNRLLWVRANNSLERAFKAVDLLLHSGGFGLVALNIGDVPAKAIRRIISSWWFRFRRGLENTPTALIVISPVACVRSCAALVLEVTNEASIWPSTLSLVSENFNSTLTKERRGLTPHLSLVAKPALRPSGYSTLSHSHFMQELCVRVNPERPIDVSGQVTRFACRP